MTAYLKGVDKECRFLSAVILSKTTGYGGVCELVVLWDVAVNRPVWYWSLARSLVR